MAEIALEVQVGIEGQSRNIEVQVNKHRRYMAVQIEKSTVPVPEYPGPYSVRPQLYYGLTLPTKGYQMADDVTVNPVPLYEVSNPAGGVTITIG